MIRSGRAERLPVGTRTAIVLASQTEADGHGWRMQHHDRPGRRPRGTVRMAGQDVEPAVPDAELLPQVTSKPLAPAVKAYSIATEGQLIAASVEPIAQVVVVPISHPFIEQPDLVESTG